MALPYLLLLKKKLFFGSNIFWIQHFFGPNISLGPNFFCAQKFSGTKILLDSNFIKPKIILDKLFGSIEGKLECGFAQPSLLSISIVLREKVTMVKYKR